jgi:hypothetical protein
MKGPAMEAAAREAVSFLLSRVVDSQLLLVLPLAAENKVISAEVDSQGSYERPAA